MICGKWCVCDGVCSLLCQGLIDCLRRAWHVAWVFWLMVIASTAQGGGGSFEDRKPIGEVSCCDAWMAERTH